MNRLASILPASQVLVGVEATSKKRAFEEAGLLFENLHGLSRALISDSLFARVRLGSSCLSHGVAIPHGRIKGLKAPMAAVLQLAQPIGFDAPDEQPVGLLIFLLVPEAATQKHLEILSEIAELLSDADLRERIKSAASVDELHGLIANWKSAQQVTPGAADAASPWNGDNAGCRGTPTTAFPNGLLRGPFVGLLRSPAIQGFSCVVIA